MTEINNDPAATKQRSNNLRAKEDITNDHELSNVFVGAKFYNVRKSPTLPKISISLGTSDNKRATSASGLQEGSSRISHNKRTTSASGLQEGIPMVNDISRSVDCLFRILMVIVTLDHPEILLGIFDISTER